MLETPDVPGLARVMRVQPRPDEKPASGFSWADYEDVRVDETARRDYDSDGEDDGWGVVTSRGRSSTHPFLHLHSMARSNNAPNAEPNRAPSVQSQSQKAPESLTKKQRQNANKRDAQKAAKAEFEAERQANLAKHKRELERAKMVEQFSGKGGGKLPSRG